MGTCVADSGKQQLWVAWRQVGGNTESSQELRLEQDGMSLLPAQDAGMEKRKLMLQWGAEELKCKPRNVDRPPAPAPIEPGAEDGYRSLSRSQPHSDRNNSSPDSLWQRCLTHYYQNKFRIMVGLHLLKEDVCIPAREEAWEGFFH